MCVFLGAGVIAYIRLKLTARSMRTYLIGYDLDKPEQDYSELINAIKEFDGWWHHLDSTWIIKTDDTAVQIRDYLKQHIGPSDKLLVAQLSGVAAWAGFSDEGSKWLKENLSSN
jgi:hypothetical protein